VTACLGEASALKDTRTEVFTLSGDGLKVGFARHVDPDGFSTSGTTVWLLQRFAIARADEQSCLSDESQLTWTLSHHNFDDEFAVTDGQLSYQMHLPRSGYDAPIGFTLEATRGGQSEWGPVGLTLESCHELLEDEDCTEKYK
jgi:hypothetical protein